MNKCVLLLLFMASMASYAREQSDIRLNPELGDISSDAPAEHARYPFINLQKNVIEMNGADWSRLSAAFDHADSSVVRVLHIGDSHIQAEGSTARTRMHMQDKYGSAGRGLTAPFRLAGTNAPLDYSYKSNSSFTGSRLLKTPWPTAMGFSGVAIEPAGEAYDITITCGEAFDKLRIYSADGTPVEVDSVEPDILAAEISPAPGITELLLSRPVTELCMNLRGKSALTAVELIRGTRGVEYSAIGNNGATFSTYNDLPGFAAEVAMLRPHIIILSLGTNEAFGRLDAEEMSSQIHRLVSDLRMSCPEAFLLLTTPQECYKRVTTRRSKRRKRRATRSYVVNDNVARAREIIKNYGVTHEIPVYDWYTVAGGSGSAAKWLGEHLMNTDRIHLTWDGYHLNGDLFFSALDRAISSSSSISQSEDK